MRAGGKLRQLRKGEAQHGEEGGVWREGGERCSLRDEAAMLVAFVPQFVACVTLSRSLAYFV